MTQQQTSENSLTLTRVFKAPLERVYRAFTDPAELAKWYAPGDMTTTVNAFDLKVGGKFSVTMKGLTPEGTDGTHTAVGVFKEIVPNQKLVKSWAWEGADAMEGEPTTITFVFKEVDGGTEVTLIHEGMPNAEATQNHTEGWVGCLDNLAKVL